MALSWFVLTMVGGYHGIPQNDQCHRGLFWTIGASEDDHAALGRRYELRLRMDEEVVKRHDSWHGLASKMP